MNGASGAGGSVTFHAPSAAVSSRDTADPTYRPPDLPPTKTTQRSNMVARKVFIAVAIVSTIVCAHGKPVDENDWATPFETALKNLTSKFAEVAGNNSEYSNMVKTGLNTFVDNFKSELSTLSKTLDGKAGVSDMVKEATKQWQSAVDTYGKNISNELSVQKLNEKFETTLKYITQNATELSKKAQGNLEVDKEIRDFTKKQIDALMEQVKSIQGKFTEKKA